MQEIRVGILGAGGLGMAAVKVIEKKKEMKTVAICDSEGYAFLPDGLLSSNLCQEPGKSVGTISCGKLTKDSILEMINLSKNGAIDSIFVALPNLPNTFIPETIERFIKAGVSMTFVDAIKRTSAMEVLFGINEGLIKTKSTYITGAGATPGLLSAAAVLASQSFVEVESVDIRWGVGISNWEEYKATIREDIAHLPGYTLNKAKEMTDEEIEKLLDERDGILEFDHMEHADELLLEKVGVVSSRDKVNVGGVLDTRRPKKPTTTTVSVTGITFDGKRSTNKFMLGDETSMAANVIGTVLGYIKCAVWLNRHGIYGIFGSTEFMPHVVR